MNQRETILETAQKMIKGFSKLKSRLGVQLLFGGMTGEMGGTGLTADELAQIEGAIMWILAVAPDLAHSGEHGVEVLDFAAETFEYMSLLSGEPVAVDEIPFSAYSAILYASESKSPNAKLLSVGMDKALTRDLTKAKSLSDLVTYLLHCLIFLAAGDFFALQRATTVNEFVRSSLQRVLEAQPHYYRTFTCIILAYEALRLFTSYVLTGEQKELMSSQEKLSKARTFARHDPLLAEMERYVSFLVETILPSLATTVLVPFTDLLSVDYQALLKKGKRPIFALWPPQIHALEREFLTTDHVGLSMPTSSGKTLLAEMKIASEINKDPAGLVFYVVPLNALARQIGRDLQERLKLAPLRYNIKVLTGTYEIEDSDLAATRKENVIVTTPEKLDSLLRNIDRAPIRSYFERCRLFIFDECHSIGEGKRGITYEFLIARLLRAFPATRTLALSAVFSNIADFAQWVAKYQGTHKAITHSWRPTATHWATWSGTDGFVYEGTWGDKEFTRSADTKAEAARLAVDLQRAYKNVLIIAGRRDMCENYAGALVQLVRKLDRAILTAEEQTRLKNLSNRIRKEILPDSELANWVELGIAYHHSHLPSDLRASIEDYIADGTLKFVVSTTTLSEGVNFPIRCVILPNILVGERPLSAIKLRNIIGRAGRAHVSTSGLAVVFKKYRNVQLGNRSFNFDKYCFDPPEELTQVTSVLKDLLRQGTSFDQVNEQQVLDSQVLAFLLLPGMQVENQATEIEGTTFLETTEPTLKDEVVGLVERRMQSMATGSEPVLVAGSPYQPTKYGERVVKTGLGLRDANLLTQLLREIAREAPDYFTRMGVGDKLDAIKTKTLILLAFTTLESQLNSYGLHAQCKQVMGESITTIRKDVSGFIDAFETSESFREKVNNTIFSLDVELVWKWINGATAQDLAKLLSDEYSPLKNNLERAVIEAIHFIENENLRYSVSWPLYAINLLLEFLLEEGVFEGPLSPQLENLPYYLKHGVAHPMAVMIMEKVKDRDFRQDSMKIALGYDVETSFPRAQQIILQAVLELGEDEIARKIGDRERASKIWNLLM